MRPTALRLMAGLLLLAGCAGGRGAVKASALGSAVGGAAGAIVGHQHGQAGLGKSVGSSLGSAAGTLADAGRAAAPAPASNPDAPAKFCPIGGEWYPERMRYCPLHGAELRRRDAPQP